MIIKKVLHKLIIFITLVALCTCVIFISSRPKKANAEVITGAILGVGALATLVASYFAVAGVQLTQSGGNETYFEGFINDTVNKFKQADADHKAMVEKYFDDQGRYIGTEEDLQFVLTDQARGYWNMGKELNQTMESIKDWFVGDNSLTVGTNTTISSETGGSYLFGSYPMMTLGSLSNTPVIPNAVGTYNLPLYDNYSVTIEITNVSGNQYTTFNAYSYNGNQLINSATNVTVEAGNGAMLYTIVLVGYPGFDANSEFRFYAVRSTDYMYRRFFDTGISSGGVTESTIGMEGTLTDGYEDFQDALNQDLENEKDNADAVVGVGVGDLGLDTTADNVLEKILAKILAGELETTYEGVYENQEEAAEEQEGEKPLVPEYPVDWVIVDGLEDFFPFCIPWDLYAIISELNVPPETPQFIYTIDFGGLFDSQDIDVDLSIFDTVAEVFRIMMVIGFVIFLIFKTRDLIRG